MIALVLGLGFGVALERAGLGNARKLTAQFYLTDLTVFKVMFSAIVTAMLGLTILDATGLVPLARIEPVSTWLAPQLAGGVLFGVGFVMGGYCPGTSCVAAASGRLDGLAAVAGIFGGSFLFGEVFPLVRGFYESTPLGPLTITDLIGAPRWVIAAAITGIAIAGFVFAARIERRPTPTTGSAQLADHR